MSLIVYGAAAKSTQVGLAGVPVIEPDDLPSPAGEQPLHELVRPADALGRGAHDQEHHRISPGSPEALGPQLQAGRIDKSLIAIQHEARLMCVSLFIKCRLARPIRQFDVIISEEARVESGWHRPLVRVTVDGMRAEDGGVLVGGLAIVFLFFWFCVKVGIKPTVGLFYGWTLAAGGLVASSRMRSVEETAVGEHSDVTPPQA